MCVIINMERAHQLVIHPPLNTNIFSQSPFDPDSVARSTGACNRAIGSNIIQLNEKTEKNKQISRRPENEINS